MNPYKKEGKKKLEVAKEGEIIMRIYYVRKKYLLSLNSRPKKIALALVSGRVKICLCKTQVFILVLRHHEKETCVDFKSCGKFCVKISFRYFETPCKLFRDSAS